uniref:Uncharacterized protein n=1 Tax=Human herpesvirus 2 TaxID=10310 RepID=A0A481TMM1_HHV2|nr:hypothetical protein [Human alphaherpesvirus 2]
MSGTTNISPWFTTWNPTYANSSGSVRSRGARV